MNFKQFLEMTNKPLFGWLSPRGNFYQVDIFRHLNAISQFPELKNLIPNFDQEMEQVERHANNSQELIAQGEHPEWHHEIAEYDFRTKAIKMLYSAGCLRVGTAQGLLHFEGFPLAIQNLHQKAKDLAEEHGMMAKFDPKHYKPIH